MPLWISFMSRKRARRRKGHDLSARLLDILISSFPRILVQGLLVTIPLTVLSFSLALVIAVLCAMVQVANVPVLRKIVRFYIWIVRGTPLLVQLYLLYFGLPDLGIVLPAFPCAVLVFALNEGAYCAETMRASIEAVPRGQMEAASCVGMTYLQAMRRIVLPQAFRIAFPPLSNSLISMVKDTSLAANITVTEMFMAAQRVAGRTYEHLALYAEVAVIYLIFCTVITKLQAFGEKKLGQMNGGETIRAGA